ncbi:hypothetical protein ONE63_004948 [Megalurothrips usitatus]|uniref:Peptidase S1 domain-containing protein n=1 Tax=Megalurothrips usitatus TaxID=439358 RepID=A0AAV7X1B7_9NEOP|nr:hypothetical protein ONE63_004948 [Megalurothrips usitatus]
MCLYYLCLIYLLYLCPHCVSPTRLSNASLVLALPPGNPISLTEARTTLETWRPEVHGAIAVKVGEIPYQASIRLYSPESTQHKCGGAVISAWHVLTAARCISYSAPLSPESVFVVVGSVKRSSLDVGDIDTVVRKVANIARHPEFSSRDLRHDLAVLTLNMALPMDRMDRIAAIPLPVGGIQVNFGTTCVVSGWGNNTVGGTCGPSPVESDALLTAEVPFIGRDYCAHLLNPAALQAGVVCTAHQKGGVGACVGDQGGPLSCNGFLAGIVSWGQGCGAGARPTVYTSLADHVGWVRDQMSVSPRPGHGGHGGHGLWGVNGATARSPSTPMVAFLAAAAAVAAVGHLLHSRLEP